MIKNRLFGTDLINLKQIENIKFVIPSYQRPYVWGDQEVKKLLSDFYKAFQKDKNSNYYIGTILTRENSFEAELIDGQQRFTTMWLIAFVFWTKQSGSEIEKILKTPDGKLKMSFEIRTEVANYLYALIKNKETAEEAIYNTQEHPYLQNIARALTTIQSIIDEEVPEIELKDFGNYINSRVRLIKNTTPKKQDLNKLFSTINSAGVQLEQTDIVKSNLLNHIDEKVLYGKIWESCEDMSNFFERNARISFPKSSWAKIDLSKQINFNKSIFIYEDMDSGNFGNENFTIDDIDVENLEPYKDSGLRDQDEKRDSEVIYCRSIINFGQLLLHTYRIHLKLEDKPDFEGTFHVNRLIEIFSNLKDQAEIKRFIERLWTIRNLFDKYIVKWVSDNNTKIESLELLNINKNSENYYSRTPYEKSAILMLQSVLYFTGDYLRQFWLTPFLYFLYKKNQDKSATDESILKGLEKIDNQLSLCSSMNDKDATYKMLELDLNFELKFEEYLNKSNGTKFKHYWFQKLEYLLWKNWREDNKTEEFNNYRIVSRNSIEHIYPQKNAKIDDDHLHSFGNLVLLSVSQNSEYGAKPVGVKRSMFKEKKNTYDTLKSYFIFQKDGEWDVTSIRVHRDEMIKVIQEHYKRDTNAHHLTEKGGDLIKSFGA
ncbi:DUF262 domain-containing protein [Salinimicrobium gaetbulicola]|uniref:DUF262 domain-containing protein n=1 Tax=Salinimicrobium gaetbulicola TaxID=999702 RepID=A0ABW3IF18_9FLAO